MSRDVEVTVDGVVYPSLAALADASGVTRSTISYRYRQGWRGEDLVKPIKAPNSGRPVSVTLDGEFYKSLSALAKAYQLEPSMVCNRYRSGKRGKSLVEGSPLLVKPEKRMAAKVLSAPKRRNWKYEKPDTNTQRCRDTTEILRTMW